jgi:hypothetical protein
MLPTSPDPHDEGAPEPPVAPVVSYSTTFSMLKREPFEERHFTGSELKGEAEGPRERPACA